MINAFTSVYKKALELSGQPIGYNKTNIEDFIVNKKAIVKYKNNSVITSDFIVQSADELLFITDNVFELNGYIDYRGGLYQIKAIDNTIPDYYTYYTEYTGKAKVYTISLDVTQITVKKTGTYNLIATCKQDGVTITVPIVTYESTNNTIATINSSGVITGVNNGTCIIRATFNGVSAECSVTVREVAYSIQLSSNSSTIKVQDSYNIVTTCKADDVVVPDAVVNFSSTNNNIATVDSTGNITGVSEGTCNIRCTYFNAEAIFTVTVEANTLPTNYQILGANTIRVTYTETYTLDPKVGSTVWTTDAPTIVQITAIDDYTVQVKALIKDEIAILFCQCGNGLNVSKVIQTMR